MLEIVGLLIIGTVVGFVGLILHCQYGGRPGRSAKDH
jgi:hypothetical protein